MNLNKPRPPQPASIESQTRQPNVFRSTTMTEQERDARTLDTILCLKHLDDMMCHLHGERIFQHPRFQNKWQVVRDAVGGFVGCIEKALTPADIDFMDNDGTYGKASKEVLTKFKERQ